MRLGWSLANTTFDGNLESGGRFCNDAFCRNLASVAVKMFPHLIYLKNILYRCTSNAICEDNAAINCITVQYKNCSLPSTILGHTKLVRNNKLTI
jgi:hypothetical protein